MNLLFRLAGKFVLLVLGFAAVLSVVIIVGAMFAPATSY